MTETAPEQQEETQALEEAKAELEKLLEQGAISQNDYQTSLKAIEAAA